MDNVRETLNKANLAIRKYYVTAANVGVGTDKSVLEEPKRNAIAAIKEFTDAKREANEMKLSPYEEYCLGFMAAADEIAAYKTDFHNLDHQYECGGHKEGHCCGQH